MTEPLDPVYQSGGVKPIGFIEPLNEWQKQGLTSLADPLSAGNMMYALAAGLLPTAAGQIEGAAAPITGDEFRTRVSDYMNPFLDEVLNRTTSRINEAGDAARARLMSSQGFRKAFGDTSLGVQGAELDKNLINSIGDATANLSYAGYGDAASKALSTLTGERDRSLSAAGASGGLSSLASGLGSLFDTRQMQNAKNLLSAGTAIQDQNQRYLDVLNPEIKGVQNFPITNLKMLADLLNAFPGSTMENHFTEEPNDMSRLANLATAAGGIDWKNIFG